MMAITSGGISMGRDEEQDERLQRLERILEELLGLGSDELISRLEKVDLELDDVRSQYKSVLKQYQRKWRYIFLDWYRSQLR